tara:strand:+ start:508 stop:660 length:153 start_codon:yes stop_codon:yes gene_type:complete
MKKQNDPKIKFTFDGCYNYKKLKEEGLVDDPQKEEDEWIRLQRTGGGAET